MEAKAVTRYIRISPRKLRLVIDAVRYKRIQNAYAILSTMKNKGARIMTKTLQSAHANAKDKKMDEAKLYVERVFADGGPTMKRFMSRSMGRADAMLRRMSHLCVVLGEKKTAMRGVEPSAKEDTQKKTTAPKQKKSKKKAQAAAS